eukprot:UN06788
MMPWKLFKSIDNSDYYWIWDYMFEGPFKTITEFTDYLKDFPSDWIIYVVIYNKTSEKVGLIKYSYIEIPHKCIEMGTWLTPKVHGTYVNTEAKYLLIKYAFEVLKFRRP